MDNKFNLIEPITLSESRIHKIEKFNDIAKAVFILLLAISSNFVVSTFNCELQKEFYYNPFAIHSFVFAIVFFSINILGNIKEDYTFYEIVSHSVLIYIAYLLLTKQTPALFLLSIILIISIFLITIYIKKNSDDDNDNKINSIVVVNYYIEIFLFLVLIYGFYQSYSNEVNKLGENFSFLGYLFKISNCRK